jgi:hypothetical protein
MLAGLLRLAGLVVVERLGLAVLLAALLGEQWALERQVWR